VVGKLESGYKANVVVLRDKKELNLEVEIGARPENLEEGPTLESNVSAGKWRGLEVEDLSSDNARRLKVEEKKGVVVVNVEPNSPADEAGIMPGEVIVEINKQAINNMSDYEKVTRSLKGDALARTSRGYFLIKGD
jgi:serine protease Do